jgi:hypothetical protein
MEQDQSTPEVVEQEVQEAAVQEAPQTVRSAIQEARARLAEGKPLIAGDSDAEEEPTNDQGAEAEVQAEAEEVGAGDQEAGEDVQAEAGDDQGEGGSDGDEGDETVVFMIPPRNPNEPEVEVEIPAELREHFSRLKNGYMRGEAARQTLAKAESKEAELRAERDEIQFIDQALQEDPVGFISTRVAPEFRKALLMELLADDSVWKDEELQDHIRSWEHDPDRRDSFRTKVERDRLKQAQERDTRAQQVRVAREGAAKTATLVRQFMDQEDDPGRRDKFHRMAMNRLADLAYETGRTEFTRDELIEFLDKEGVLDGYGLRAADLRTAASGNAEADASSPRQEQGRSNSGARPAVRARPATADQARETGKRLKEGSDRRKAAASYAPVGAGAPAAGVELPKGQSVKERIDYVRRRGIAAIVNQA